MSRKSLPKYRKQTRPIGKHLAFVEIGGIRRYLGSYGSKESKQEYARLIAEWETTGGQFPVARDQSTVTELLAAYWTFAEGYYHKNGEPTVELSKIKATMRPINKLYGRTLVSEFGPLALKTVREKMIRDGYSRGKTRLPYSRTHINQQIAVIKRCFKWGVENELVPSDVLHALQSVSGLRKGRSKARESQKVKPVCDDHINAVKPHVSRQVWGIIQLQLLTGMRSGEAVIMRGKDIDTRGEVWQYRPEAYKTEHYGYERIVDIGPRSQDIIKQFLKSDVEAYLFSPRDAESARYAKARTHRRKDQEANSRKTNRKIGERYTTASYRRSIEYACQKAKVDRWHPHQLRHAAGSRFRKEFGIEVARCLLGHATAFTTEIYSEFDREKSRDAMSKIG